MSHILLIEPDFLLADCYRRIFEFQGDHVMMCSTAQSAIFAADERQPDIVVMELQLIAHSGIEFLYEFRTYSDWLKIPVIIQTHIPAGEFFNSWQLLRDELAVKAYLYKPLTSLRRLCQEVNDLKTVLV